MFRSAILLGTLFCAAQSITAADLKSVDARAESSHERFLSLVTNQTERAYLEIAEIYDAAIAANPGNSQPMIEQCKFIERAFPVGEDSDHPKQADLDAAIRQLTERFPRDPEAVLYRAERLHGEERIQFLKEFTNPNLIAWTEKQLARSFEMLAWAHYFQDHFAEAKSRAEAAMKLDRSRDLSLIIASYYDSIHREDLVPRALIPHLDAEVEPWKKQRKAQLLNKAGQPRLALLIYESFRDEKVAYVDSLEYADVLEKCARWSAAREQLVKTTAAPGRADTARRRLFDFDLKHGDEKAVLESYRAFCDEGLQNDPLLRRRLAVAFKYPTAPWTAADAIRSAVLVAVIALLLLAPLAWILPTHYVGLLRERRLTAKVPQEQFWHLGHFWCVSVVWLLAGFLAIFCFQYDEFFGFYLDDQTTDLVFDPERLAPTTLTYALVCFSGVLVLQRKRHWLLAIRNRWGFWRSVLVVVASLILLRIAFRLLSLVFDQVTGLLPAMTDFVPGVTRTRVEMILAVGRQYGMGVLFLLVVIVAPLTEEFAFRGIFLDSVGRHLSFHVANIIQAIVFAVFHEEPSHFMFFLLFGWIAGMMRRDSNGLALPLSFHALNNLFVFAQIWRMAA